MMRYRLVENKLVKYISLPIEKIIRNPQMIFELGEVSEDMFNMIFLGPKNYNGPNEIMDFLSTEDFSFFPGKSEISYR